MSVRRYVNYNGKKYEWDGARWVEYLTRLIPPSTTANQLNKILQVQLKGAPIPKTTTSSVIFYWTWFNYVNDIKELGKTFELNQDNSLIKSMIKGDHIWAFTRKDEKLFVMAMDLVVSHTRDNLSSDPGHKYGKYCAVGDPNRSRYFNVSSVLGIENVLWGLHFFTKETKVDTIGQMFQGINAVRPLTMEEDTRFQQLSNKYSLIT